MSDVKPADAFHSIRIRNPRKLPYSKTARIMCICAFALKCTKTTYQEKGRTDCGEQSKHLQHIQTAAAAGAAAKLIARNCVDYGVDGIWSRRPPDVSIVCVYVCCVTIIIKCKHSPQYTHTCRSNVHYAVALQNAFIATANVLFRCE